MSETRPTIVITVRAVGTNRFLPPRDIVQVCCIEADGVSKVAFPEGCSIKLDGLVKSQEMPFSVIPAKAGIQSFHRLQEFMAPGFHRGDDFLRTVMPAVAGMTVRKKIEGERSAHSHRRYLDSRQRHEAWVGALFIRRPLWRDRRSVVTVRNKK